MAVLRLAEWLLLTNGVVAEEVVCCVREMDGVGVVFAGLG